jgi:hypothetical protein
LGVERGATAVALGGKMSGCNRIHRQHRSEIAIDRSSTQFRSVASAKAIALGLCKALTLLAWPLLGIAGPFSAVVPIQIDDITILVPVTPNTGSSVPSFDAYYVQDYQYAPKYTLTFPDGRTHQVPKVDGPDGRPYIPYTQALSTGCWDTGYLIPCPAGAPCQRRQPRCVQNLIQGDTLSIRGRVSIPGGRFLLPGEITPDGYALVPMETNLDRTFLFNGSTYYALWSNIYPKDVTFANIGIQTQGNYFAGLPSEGGPGPHPDCGVWGCVQVADRVVFVLLGPMLPVGPDGYIHATASVTGFATGGLFQDFKDLVTESKHLNDPNNNPPSPTQQAMVDAITSLHLFVDKSTCHSLGTLSCTGLFNDGFLPNVVNLSPLFWISNEALQSKASGTITNYSFSNDFFSQGFLGNAGASRISAGVNWIDLGFGNHGRVPYLGAIGASPF